MDTFNRAPARQHSVSSGTREAPPFRADAQSLPESVLAEAVQCVPEGFAVFDPSDRLVHFNAAFRDDLFAPVSDCVRIGATMEELARAAFRFMHGLPDGSPELARLVGDAMARHRDLPGVSEVEWMDRRWVRQCKRRTSSGYIAATYVDITEIKRSERRATDNQNRFRALINGCPDGIVVVCDDIYAFASPRAAELTGCSSPADLVGRRALDFVAPDQHDGILQSRRALLESPERDRAVAGDVRLRRRDGMEFAAKFWTARISWDDRPAILILLRDDTEAVLTRDALRESEAVFRNIANNIPGMVYQRVIEADGTISYPYVNDAALEISGYSAQQISQDPGLLMAAIHPDDQEAYVLSLRSTFQSLAQHSSDVRYNHPKLGLRWIHTLSRPRRRNDGTIVAEAIAFDITDRKAIEARFEENQHRLNEHVTELQDTRDRLDQRSTELVRTVAQLAEARDAAEAANRAKSEFLATISHEIRTPMNGVLGMASVLAQSDLNESQRDYLDTICQSGEALLEIIDDVLDYSKMEAGQITLEATTFAIADILDGAVQLLRPRYRQKGLSITTFMDRNVPDTIVGDPGRLRQILINLIGNAVKFTQKGSISVECRIAEIVGRRAVLSFAIIDTGIGISAAGQSRLFEVFSQADASTTRRFGGTGLGLSICKRLCALMGGSISVESAPDCGSTFRFTASFGIAPDATAPWPVAARTAMIISSPALPDSGIRHQIEAYGFRVLDDTELENALGIDLLVIHQGSADASNAIVRELLRDRAAAQPTVWVIAPEKTSALVETPDEFTDRYFEPPLRQSSLRAAARALHVLSPQTDAPGPAPEDSAGPDNGTPDAEAGCPAAETSPAAAAPLPAAVLSLLLVEDNEINQRVAVALLHRTGARVTIAENGVAALEAVRRKDFDAILMDIHMPEMDGVTASREIRSLPPPKCDVPIIALTANAMAGDRERYLAAGMNDYVSKPIDPSLLAQAVERQTGVPVRIGTASPAPPSAATGAAPADSSAVDSLFSEFTDISR